MCVLAGEAFGDACHDYLVQLVLLFKWSLPCRKAGVTYIFGSHEGEFFLDPASDNFGVHDEAGCDVIYLDHIRSALLRGD